MSFRIERSQIIPSCNSITNTGKELENSDFQKLLDQNIYNKQKIKISYHAQQRMFERDITLQEADMDRINQAMNNLEKKGAKESLMIYKDMAFIASVQNKTIITALQEEELDVVTNIDSAILVK